MALKIQRAGHDLKPRLKILLCGDQGAGKTLLASTFPNPFIASVEGGMLSLQDRETRYHEVLSSKDMDEIISYLRQPEQIRNTYFDGPVDTLVIDTLDQFQRMLKRERMRETGHDMQMQDWGWLGEKLGSFLEGWFSLYETAGVNLVVTCHLGSDKDEEIGRVSYLPLLEGQIKNSVGTKFDIVGILEARAKSTIDTSSGKSVNVRGIERRLRLYPDANNSFLKDRSGKLPLEFPVNLQDDYKRMYDIVFAGWEARREAREEALRKDEAEAEARVEKLTELLAEQKAAEPAPVEEAKAAAPVLAVVAAAEQAEATITLEEFQQLVAPLKLILSDDDRRDVKNAFMQEYGNPAILPPKQLEAATKWIAEAIETWKKTQVESLKEATAEVIDRPATEGEAPAVGAEVGDDVCVTCGEKVDDPEVITIAKDAYGVVLCRNDFRNYGK